MIVATYFFDTSALVKRYIQETGSAWVRNVTNPASGHSIFLIRITEVELTSAIARRRDLSLTKIQAVSASDQFHKEFVRNFKIVEITIPLLQSASLMADRHRLRAYDAVQLAGSLIVRGVSPELILVSSDDVLNAAERWAVPRLQIDRDHASSGSCFAQITVSGFANVTTSICRPEVQLAPSRSTR